MAQHGWSPTNPVEKADQPTLQPSRNEILVDLRIPTKLICKQFEALIAQHPKFRIYQAKFGNSQKPDLIILEPDFDHHLTMAFIASVKKDDKGPDIFLTASQPDISLMVEALRAGVREFFLQPIQEPEILEALDRCATRFHARHNASPRKMGKIISVLGGRGGIGTTSFVVNLGASLRQIEPSPSIALVELNRNAGDLALFLDLKTSNTLRDLGTDYSRLDYPLLQQFLFKHDSGVALLSSGYNDLIAKRLPPEWVDPILKLLQAHFDFVILDCGHLLGSTTKKAFEVSEMVLLLCTLSVPVVTRLKKLMNYFNQHSFPSSRVKWVVNRYTEGEKEILKEAEQLFNSPPTWIIPNDYPRAIQGINSGKPLVLDCPKSSIARAYRKMATSLLPSGHMPPPQRQWVNRVWRKVKEKGKGTLVGINSS